MASNHSKPVVRWASAALALVGATALALTGCSTTTGGGDTPTDGGTAAPQSVIKLGEIGDFTSQAGTAYPGIPRVIQLAIDDLNANGGINGAEVELVTCDLQYLPTRRRAARGRWSRQACPRCSSSRWSARRRSRRSSKRRTSRTSRHTR